MIYLYLKYLKFIHFMLLSANVLSDSTQAEFSCTNYCARHRWQISIAWICKHWAKLAHNTYFI